LRLSFLAGLAGVIAFVAVFFFGVSSLLGWPVDADPGCADGAFVCNAGLELFGTVVAVAFAFLSFAGWRFFRVPADYRADAELEASRFVPTATQIDDVVGREGICTILIEDLCQKKPRPQIIVGGVGSGKTALLVRLTQRLAGLGAVPVAVRLRDAQQELDFVDLARGRFLRHVEDKLHFGEEGTRIWNKLCADRRVVILADGLEEALLEVPERRAAIAEAIKAAGKANHLLVIATRPDEALLDIDAAFVRLEPLSASDAVRYIRDAGEEQEVAGGRQPEPEDIACAAEVAEAPFFLRITRGLYRDDAQKRRLAALDLTQSPLVVRVELLEHWLDWLCSDAPPLGARVPAAERRAAVRELESMARVALRENTLELGFARYEQSPHRELHWDEDVDVKGMVRVGELLELCELVSNGIRFRHSLMQAYLGARGLSNSLYRWEWDALRRGLAVSIRNRSRPERKMAQRYLDRALRRPARELLIALEMHCVKQSDRTRCRVRRALLDQACATRDGVAALDMLSSAYQIESLRRERARNVLGRAAEEVWGVGARHDDGAPIVGNGRRTASADARSIDAKLRAVCSIERLPGKETYDALWKVCMSEKSYRVRLRAAQAIGSGGDDALRAVAPHIEAALDGRYRLTRNGGFDQTDVRRGIVCAWVLPLLVSSCRANAGAAYEMLSGWVQLPELHLGVQAHIAQGLKFEANRRPDHRDGRPRPDARRQLVQLAIDMAGANAWWYSEIAIVHALTLWWLDEGLDQALIDGELRNMAADGKHPFVQVAASLCLDALRRTPEENPPSRYMWIDEVGSAARVGPDRLAPDADLWIPVAAGWFSLDGDARQLLADVFVYLTLIERAGDEEVSERERRRWAALRHGAKLPYCLDHGVDRAALVLPRADARGRPTTDKSRPGPEGVAVVLTDGSHGCRPGCGLGLCPYPSKDEHPFRGELSETFCREQQRLLRGRHKHVPVWQRQAFSRLYRRRVASGLEEFWHSMERRDETTRAV
jgi:hypothetical protein